MSEIPDLSTADYTIILPHDDACELIAGRVPHQVLVVLISAIKALHETPAEGVDTMKRRRARKDRAA
jgi:hypothetical protein